MNAAPFNRFRSNAAICMQLLDISYTSSKLSCRLVACYNQYIEQHKDFERLLANLTRFIRDAFILSKDENENKALGTGQYMPSFITKNIDEELRNTFRVGLENDQFYVYLDWNRELATKDTKAPLIRLLANMQGGDSFTYRTFFQTVNNIHYYKI